eukprot:557272-Ditylum_brightwellii.AAC.1
MDSALFQQHVRHFSQATGTPFTVNPLVNVLGKYAEVQGREQYRNGTLDIENLDVDNYTKEFLKEMQHTSDDSLEIDATLKGDDIKRNYKNWKEATTTSPSGCYLSLYKTWINVPEKEDEDYKGITSADFFQLINDIMKVATSLLYPLQRWIL